MHTPKQGQVTSTPCPAPWFKKKKKNTFSSSSEFIFISYRLHQWKSKVMIFLDSHIFVYRIKTCIRGQLIFFFLCRERSTNF